MAEIDRLTKELRVLVDQLQAQASVAQAHDASRPQPPGAKASNEAKNKYQQALSAWEQQSATLVSRLRAIVVQVERKQLELATAVANLPMGQRADLSRAEQTRKAADGALAAARPFLGGSPAPANRALGQPRPAGRGLPIE